jgi:hypothetical protein
MSVASRAGDSQQQADSGPEEQQGRPNLPAAFAEQADASPTAENTPTIAARAIQGGRR